MMSKRTCLFRDVALVTPFYFGFVFFFGVDREVFQFRDLFPRYAKHARRFQFSTRPAERAYSTGCYPVRLWR